MRRIVGKRTVEVSAAEFAQLRSKYAEVLVDIGTGDGKHVLHVARQRPECLVIGMDASADAMRKAAARAAAKESRGGLPNALFVWSAVERFPPELTGLAEIHVLMPWGSLLRAVAGADPQVLSTLAGACLSGARFLVTLNLHAWRPPVPEVGDLAEPTPETALDELAKRYAEAGWRLAEASYLGADEIAGLATSWTKRLGSSRDQLDVLGLTGTIDSATHPRVD